MCIRGIKKKDWQAFSKKKKKRWGRPKNYSKWKMCVQFLIELWRYFLTVPSICLQFNVVSGQIQIPNTFRVVKNSYL